MNVSSRNRTRQNPPRRVASLRHGPAAVWFAALLLVSVSCSDVSDLDDRTSSPATASEAVEQPDSAAPTVEAASADNTSPSSTEIAAGSSALAEPEAEMPETGSELAALITKLPSAPIGAPELEAPQAQPSGLTIESLGVETAAVIGVGIEPNGDMEVPPADQVGWYQYGPEPGAEGSSVLAAHIAYNGSDGVFVNLDDIDLGATIEISYDDGTKKRFKATDIQQYDKNELPRESVFGRTGEPQLVLITCGGDFNRSLRSYTDNVVVYASPVA